ncbi:MAG: sulfate permease [Thermoleophilia bacterium]|nr:sulfate permease [Thermoleophilia bacterium]
MRERLGRFAPIVIWLPGYRRSFFGRDLLAALAVWAVLVPQAVGYAALAGAPPDAGLATALAAGVLYAVFGTCRQLDVGPSSMTAVTAAAVLVPVVTLYPDVSYAVLLAALAVLTGVLLIIAGVLRLGFVSEFLARPVLVGFISAVAFLIIAGQIPKLLGIPAETGNLPEELWREAETFADIKWDTAAVGCVSLFALLVLRRLAPRVPWALCVTAVAIICSRAFDFSANGIAVIADVPAGLPSFALPGLGLDQFSALWSGAIAVAFVALAESIGTARSLALKGGYDIDANQELIALGTANVGTGLLQGFPADASLSRSAVGVAIGGLTRVSGLIVAAFVVLTMLFLTPFFDGLPQATLAAIIIAAVIGLVDVGGFRTLWRIDPPDAMLAVVGFASVCLLGILPGVLTAVLASLLVLVRRLYKPTITVLGRLEGEPGVDEDFMFRSIDRHPACKTIPGLVLFRFSNELFFANASFFRNATLRLVDASDPPARTVLVDAAAISHLDATAAWMLDDLLERLAAKGVTLELARTTTPLDDSLLRAGLIDRIGVDHLYPSLHDGVEAFLARVPDAHD